MTALERHPLWQITLLYTKPVYMHIVMTSDKSYQTRQLFSSVGTEKDTTWYMDLGQEKYPMSGILIRRVYMYSGVCMLCVLYLS